MTHRMLTVALGVLLVSGGASAAAQTAVPDSVGAMPQQTTAPKTAPPPQATPPPKTTPPPQATPPPKTTPPPQATPPPKTTPPSQTTPPPKTTPPPQATPPAKGTPPKQTTPPPKGTPPRKGAPARKRPPVMKYVGFDGGLQLTTTKTSPSVTYKVYGEDAVLQATYKTKMVPIAGARAGVQVWRQMTAGAGASLFGSNGDAAIVAQVPHPFFFQRPRDVAGTAAGITHNEVVLYLEVGWLKPIKPKLDVIVFVGPALFKTTQGVATTVQYFEKYPFDTATYSGVESLLKRASTVGFTLGADVSYRISKKARLGSLLRFSHATADIEPIDGQSFKLTLGGLQASVGLRIRF